MANIETAVKFMEDIAKDDSHGYDQASRNGPNYDCSSLVGTALNKGGFNVNPSSTTRNLRAQLEKNGFEKLAIDAPRKRGDIFLKEDYHVVMCVDSKNIVHASINEKGTAVGGKSGDQTGKEICVAPYWNYKGGWGYHFRHKSVTENVPTSPTNLKYKVGDSVTINGVYTNASSSTKLNPAKKQGKITKVLPGYRNPYLLENGNIGWVNDSCIVGGSSAPSNSYYSKYTGSSGRVDLVLEAIGVPSKYLYKWSNRIPVAEKNGIRGYEGSESQNKKLIELAKKGKLIKV